MTPERLQAIRQALADQSVTNGALGWAHDLLEYVDLLHEDLRLTRAELVAEKHKCLELRQGRGRASC